jgi:hypothetical protein
MISIRKITETFNPFLRKGQKLFEAHVIDYLVKTQRSPQRITGITPTAYRRLSGQPLDNSRKAARRKLTARFGDIFQRRHDSIHNCDRPKLTVQKLTHSSTLKVIEDIALLIGFCDSHFESEFNEYLHTVGANAQTRNATRYNT